MIGGNVLGFRMAAVAGRRFGRRHRLDREYRAKEAGFRTHFLVALGSALFMIVSQYGFSGVLAGADVKLDPSRVAAQVVSGIGFLGAGTIIFQKQVVRGLDDGGRPLGYGRHRAGRRRGYVLGKRLRDRADAFRAGDPDAAFQKRRDSQRAVRVFHRLARGAEEDFRRGTPAGASRNQLHDPGRGARPDHTLYRVTLVVRIRKQSDERSLFEFIQSLPDTMLELME